VQRRTGFVAQDDVRHSQLTVRETWSSPTTSSSPPLDHRDEAEEVELVVAAERGVEFAGGQSRHTTRRRRDMSEAERLSVGVQVRRRAKAVAAKRSVKAAGGRGTRRYQTLVRRVGGRAPSRWRPRHGCPGVVGRVDRKLADEHVRVESV
jgi:hypothetical protein